MRIPYSVVSLSLVVATFSMSISTIGKIKACIQHFNDNDKAVQAAEEKKPEQAE
jgi:hypothetical protein